MFASSLNVAEVEQFFTQEEGKLLSEPRSKCRLCVFVLQRVSNTVKSSTSFW
jgi:hypothetical protein